MKFNLNLMAFFNLCFVIRRNKAAKIFLIKEAPYGVSVFLRRHNLR